MRGYSSGEKSSSVVSYDRVYDHLQRHKLTLILPPVTLSVLPSKTLPRRAHRQPKVLLLTLKAPLYRSSPFI